MLITLYIIVVLTIWHTIWDGILAPSLRAKVRFELFKIRDEVRELRISRQIEFSVFESTEDVINRAINMISVIGMVELARLENAYARDSVLRAEIDARAEKRASLPQEIKKYLNRVDTLLERAIIVNSSLWSVCALPFVFMILQVQFALKLKGAARHRLKELARKLSSLKHQEIVRFVGEFEDSLAFV